MQQPDLKIVLKNISLLHTLTADELAHLATFVTILDFAENTVIIPQGKPGHGMYIIKQGRVQVNVRLPGNLENKIATLAEQDFFGEAAFIDGGITTASVITLTKTQCYFIACDYFKILQSYQPIITHKIIAVINQGISTRLNYINQQLAGRLIDSKNLEGLAKQYKMTKAITANFTHLIRLNINPDFLNTLGVFKTFSQSTLKELFSYMRLRKAVRGCVLFHEHDPAVKFYLVAQGAIQITVAKNNKLSKLSVVGPGGIFGLLPYFDQGPHSAAATAREDSVVFEFSHADMESLQHNNPVLFYQWYYAISQTLIVMLRAADKDLIRLASRLH